MNNLRKITACAALTMFVLGGSAFAQTKQQFEVASIKMSAPLDMAKMAADMQSGKMPKMGAHIDNGRAEYTYMSMRDLIVMAYGVKTYQVSGPDWLTKQRFDIVAKMPAGSMKGEAPRMLQSLLEDRFKLTSHRAKEEHAVLGLVVGKGGSKLKESKETPKAIDENEPLKPGEMVQDGPDGPVRVTVGKMGSATVNMGAKGMMSYSMNPANQAFHMAGSMITMSGFADMLSQFSQMGGTGKQVVDMTNLKGAYEVSIDFALADLLAMARANGMDIPAGAGRGPGAPAAGGAPSDAAMEPGGGAASSLTTAVQELGLKLESRKATVEQLVVDHVEKTPSDN